MYDDDIQAERHRELMWQLQQSDRNMDHLAGCFAIAMVMASAPPLWPTLLVAAGLGLLYVLWLIVVGCVKGCVELYGYWRRCKWDLLAWIDIGVGALAVVAAVICLLTAADTISSWAAFG